MVVPENRVKVPVRRCFSKNPDMLKCVFGIERQEKGSEKMVSKPNEEQMRVMLERRSGRETERCGDHRTTSERDYSRVIHSAAFRRLQNKTQVLGLGESDFYRTRLTHSMEVAQIGASITKHLEVTCQGNERAWLPDTRQIEAICLAHDIGNPPFGHGGEIALDSFMRSYGGFEGNGQTLRVLAKLEKYSESHGMDLTRRTLLGILKYPVKYSDAKNEKAFEKNKNFPPPKCYHDDEADVITWIFEAFTEKDRQRFVELKERQDKHHKPLHKGLDTSIMELADDIAYGVHDMEDAIVLSMLNEKDCEKAKNKIPEALSKNGFHVEKLFSEKKYEVKEAVGALVNYFITNVSLVSKDNFEHPLLKLNAVFSPEAEALLDVFREIVRERVIFSQNVQLLEQKGQMMIRGIFEKLCDAPFRYLPENTREKYREAKNTNTNPERIICDYVAGMTDEYALRIYQMMFLPGYGSVFNRL